MRRIFTVHIQAVDAGKCMECGIELGMCQLPGARGGALSAISEGGQKVSSQCGVDRQGCKAEECCPLFGLTRKTDQVVRLVRDSQRSFTSRGSLSASDGSISSSVE